MRRRRQANQRDRNLLVFRPCRKDNRTTERAQISTPFCVRVYRPAAFDADDSQPPAIPRRHPPSKKNNDKRQADIFSGQARVLPAENQGSQKR